MSNSRINAQNIASSLPTILFFIAYKKMGMIAATATLLTSNIAVYAMHYFNSRHIKGFDKLSLVLMFVLSLGTMATGEARYIQIHYSIIHVMLAAMLLIGISRGQNGLRGIMDERMLSVLSEQEQERLTVKWVMLFMGVAGLNELIRRFASESTWVFFASFGITIVCTIFLFAQIPMIRAAAERNVHYDMPEDREE